MCLLKVFPYESRHVVGATLREGEGDTKREFNAPFMPVHWHCTDKNAIRHITF